ncbi:MAG TPA: isoprenylcysteine carboxylmethyltransferase family protein [Rhizomicrobium sp.]|nr:isoprenylcysteine carboxylmethyltransferase family protein [Rhizomicrobium sp.]
MIRSAWSRFRETKTYDFLAATPLLVWYGDALRHQLPLLTSGLKALAAGTAEAPAVLQFLAVVGSAAFNLALVIALLVRDKPVARSSGVIPRATAVAGTFLSVAILRLPVAMPPPPVQALANILIFGGGLVSALVLWRLGTAFAIMPEARALVTSGPYALARHPLYVTEALVLLGTVMQFEQPWAVLLGMTTLALIYLRTVFEERVLLAKYPEYAAYRARTARFIPGLF